ncbi:HNH endonuclease [Nostoc sp.]
MSGLTIANFFTPAQEQTFTRTKRFRPRQMRYRKMLLVERCGMKCFWCSCELTPETLTIDHLVPLSKGGSNKLKNLRATCARCNQTRGNAMPVIQQLTGANMIDAEEQKTIRWILRIARGEALVPFIKDFLNLLNQEGFLLEDLLDALSKWAFNQRSIPSSVAKHLEDAVTELRTEAKN